MSRILLRAAKSPWMPVPTESVAAQDVIATNAGNLLFGQSMFRALSVEGTEVVANGYSTDRRGIDDRYIQRINDEFDSFVIPLANAFRPSFREGLANLSRVIEQLDMPVAVAGVGSDISVNRGDNTNSELDEEVKRFMSVVLDHSASVGVRGEDTAAYLRQLGFGDDHVDVIGCPSMFMHGPSPSVRPLQDQLTEDSSLAMSASPAMKKMVPIIRDHAQRFRRFRYIPQNAVDLNTMLWTEPNPRPYAISELVSPDSPLHINDQIRFPLDPNTWVNYLRDFDFVLGTRIHGSISGVLAGTPTLLLVHDSRTRELAEYHQIPYLPIDQITEGTRAEDLYEYADYTKFNHWLPESFDRFTAFLDKNNLPNIYQPDKHINDFDEKLNAAELPPMVHPILAQSEAGRREMVSRLWWLRQGPKVDRARSQYAFKSDLPHTQKPRVTLNSVDTKLTKEMSVLKKQLAKSQKQLTETRKLVAAQSKVIERLDVPMSTRAKRYVKRAVARKKK